MSATSSRARCPPAEVYYVIAQLEKKGYPVRAGAQCPGSRGGMVVVAGGRSEGGGPSAGGESGRMSGRLGVEAGPFRALLERMGIRLEDGLGRGDGSAWCWSTATSERSWPSTTRMPCATAVRGCSSARSAGRSGSVRCFVPGVTACWECLARGSRTNSPVATYLAEPGMAAPPRGRRRHRRAHRPRSRPPGPGRQRRCDLDRPG